MNDFNRGVQGDVAKCATCSEDGCYNPESPLLKWDGVEFIVQRCPLCAAAIGPARPAGDEKARYVIVCITVASECIDSAAMSLLVDYTTLLGMRLIRVGFAENGHWYDVDVLHSIGVGETVEMHGRKWRHLLSRWFESPSVTVKEGV